MNGMEGRAKRHEFVRTYMRNKNTAYDDLESVEALQPSARGAIHMCCGRNFTHIARNRNTTTHSRITNVAHVGYGPLLFAGWKGER